MKIILAHRYLDFDALASMAAVQRIYPDALCVIEGKYGTFVQDFLALAKEHLPFYRLKDIAVKQVEKVILVDTHDLARAVGHKETSEILAKAGLEIYDHHPFDGKIENSYTIQNVGACTTILVEIIKRKGIKISSFDATLMALGIYDDTGSLLFESTTSRDVAAVAYLLEQGAQLGVVAEYLRKPLSDEQMDLFQELLDNGNTEVFEGTQVYFTSAECPDYISGLAVIAQRIGEIESADIWFIIVKMENRVYVVARSRGNGLPVNKIAEAFGGSGHEKAASAVIKDGDVQSIQAQVRTEIQKRAAKPSLIRDIMSFPVKTVYPETTMEDVGKILLKYGHTGVPVVDQGRLAGVISRRDVDKALKHGLQHAPVKGFMTRDVVTVGPDLGWEEVQRLMVLHDIGRIPVVENGELVGIVSRSDVLRLIYGRAVPTTSLLARERSLARREDTLKLIDQLPAEIRAVFNTIKETAAKLDYSIYLVGGFVRDLLLGVPTTDLDLVVEGDGPAFAKLLYKRLDSAKLVLHKAFGTARIMMKDETHLDIAGSRREDYDFPGALPTVEESTLKEDLFRRDFTINAMALCLNKERFGEVVDYYGGFRDLQQGEIRFLHNLSFIDDPTRITRAVRFAGRYKFKLAKITRDAIGIALEAKVFTKISPERFTEELMLIYQELNYQEMGRQLISYGVLRGWFAEDYPWNYNEQDEAIGGWPLEKRWLVSLKKIAHAEVLQILDRLRLNKSLQRATLEYLHLREELIPCLDNLGLMDELLMNTPKQLIEVLARDEIFAPALTRYEAATAKIEMAVTGTKLIQLGMKEGPAIGKTLKEIRTLWLEGRITSLAEEEAYVNQAVANSAKTMQ